MFQILIIMEFGDVDDFLDGVEDSFEDLQESELFNLAISSSVAKKNYDMAGQDVPEDEDQISIAAYSHLLSDQVHQCIQEVLHEVQLPYSLSDFQLLSLHVLGSGRNLMLVSPAGSGKTNLIYLGNLLMRKDLKISDAQLFKIHVVHCGQKQISRSKRPKVGDNNGQATHGARKHAWRTQAAWAKIPAFAMHGERRMNKKEGNKLS